MSDAVETPAASLRGGRWWWGGVLVAVVGRPRLWAVAVREVALHAPRGWWRRWPPLPTPAADWLAFRMETAYGDPARRPEAGDVVVWLEWCRDMRRRRGSAR